MSSPPPKKAKTGKKSAAAAAAAAAASGQASSSSPSPGASKKASSSVPAARTSGVMEYLQTALPRSSLLGLYAEESRGRFVCRAVLQRLPQTSQQVVVRLSCCGGEFSKSLVQVWTKLSDKTHARHMNELYQWAIITENPNGKGNGEAGAGADAKTDGDDEVIIKLTPEFNKGLQSSLRSLDASPWVAVGQEQMVALEKESATLGKPQAFPAMTPEDLERYTQTQWDAVLHYLVGTPNMKVQPNPAVTHFLMETRLMQPDPEYRGSNPDQAPLVITEKGYDFMLQDNSQQVWHFVVQYLHSISSHKRGADLQREALMLLICLGFARFGECYSASASLSKDGRFMMKDLALFGLLYVKKIAKTAVFYPTRIAMQLVGSGNESSSLGGSGGGGGGGMWSLSSKALNAALSLPSPKDSSHLGIIVQTNFQLCAYTTSELHVSMLGLFCDVQTIRRLPNVVFMAITRDSIKAAFALGIKAQQILRFLEKHAHPKLRSGGVGAGATGMTSPLPGNVIDQIFLWDRERHRVQWTEVFVHQCMMNGEFDAVRKYSEGLQAHVWSSEGRNQLFLSLSKAEKIQSFIRQWRARSAS